VENLSAQRILEVWEQGETFTHENKIQAMLSLMTPELSTKAIAELVLGERNRYLLELHQHMFGGTLQAYVECSQCGEGLDLEFIIDELGFAPLPQLSEIHTLINKNITAQIRLPNSGDLSAITNAVNILDGRNLLLTRCVLKLHRDNIKISVDELNEQEIDGLDQEISRLDPRMEILFDLTCPQCAHSWQSPLEIGSFLWNKFDHYARHLLENVHVLASVYGWSEQDVLMLSQQRRDFYLQRIMQ